MSLPNAVLAIDALLGLIEATTKIQAALVLAQAEGRDISDEEIAVIRSANLKKTENLLDLIDKKLGEIS